MSTHYHCQYWAHALTLKSASDSIDNLSRSIANARVDLNPHQVDAALFAFRSPLSKGAILADEVGLGKTIEAGIVISQRWAERRRKILLILPATLRKQWQQEMEDKFHLPSVILESRNFNQMRRNGHPKAAHKAEVERCAKEVDERNGRFFDDEVAKLERWSDDLKLGLEREIKDLDQKIKEIRRESQSATALTEKLAFQKDIKAVESERNRKRRELYDAQDAIDRDRDELIGRIEKQLKVKQNSETFFTIRWQLH